MLDKHWFHRSAQDATYRPAAHTGDSLEDARVLTPEAVHAEVDVAIVAESTYPFLKGGVSAVIHDIVTGNQDLTFGIIHITWDSSSARADLYGMPENVKWVHPVYLSMQEHLEDFVNVKPGSLKLRASERTRLSNRIFDALEAITTGDNELMLDIYDQGMNPRTREYSIWSLLGTKEFMMVAGRRLEGLGLPLVDMFWLLREFFSLSFAILAEDIPLARVYHAHTTGYAALLGAVGARQNGSKFLLTEHNLYVRDTVNTLLNRSMALTLSGRDWRELDVGPLERVWMAWWIEMGRFCYPLAEVITYLYPSAISEAADLGSPQEKAVVIPNGMKVASFDAAYEERCRAIDRIEQQGSGRTWKLVYIARIVPIKGLSDLISTVEVLVTRGITNFTLDVLGPTDHHPDYYMLCREKARTLGVEDYLNFRGTVNVRELLGEFDILVLPSYNEGQPIVVLEAMTAGIPVVGTNVGGMAQLISDRLTTPGGRTFEACGLLVNPDYIIGMADALQEVMGSAQTYRQLAERARGRVVNFFQIDDVMGSYNRLYKELADLPGNTLEESDLDELAVVDLRERPADISESKGPPTLEIGSHLK